MEKRSCILVRMSIIFGALPRGRTLLFSIKFGATLRDCLCSRSLTDGRVPKLRISAHAHLLKGGVTPRSRESGARVRGRGRFRSRPLSGSPCRYMSWRGLRRRPAPARGPEKPRRPTRACSPYRGYFAFAAASSAGAAYFSSRRCRRRRPVLHPRGGPPSAGRRPCRRTRALRPARAAPPVGRSCGRAGSRLRECWG